MSCDILNKRCAFIEDNRRGTVKYVGLVQGYEGNWIGVDWDDSLSGKHNGTLNGIHYFDTLFPCSGSFVRLKKLTFGCSVFEAANAKYVNENHETINLSIGSRMIEMVGFEKTIERQKKLQNIEKLILDNSFVSHAGNEQLSDIIGNVNELDLSMCLLSSWDEVFKIINQMPKLSNVNLSSNYLCFNCNTFNTYKFMGIRTLILNSMRLTWNDMLIIAPLFPNLQELFLSGNVISDTHNIKDFLPRLVHLDLSKNPIKEWLDVFCHVNLLDKLEYLNLNQCLIKQVQISDYSNADLMKLSNLYLCSNQISDWHSINQLRNIGTLKHIMVLGNPLFLKNSQTTNRQQIIAKLDNIVCLDRETITVEERKGAEYDYLKMFALEWIQLCSSNNTVGKQAFLIDHPRFVELIVKYGLPEIGEICVPGRVDVIKNQLISLKLTFDSNLNVAAVDKKFPESMTVHKIKVIVAKLCKVKPNLLKILYKSKENPAVTYVLDNDAKDLRFYAANDGDILHVLTN